MTPSKYVKTIRCKDCGMCKGLDLEYVYGVCPYGAIQKVLTKADYETKEISQGTKKN